jgi:hypothetical protein
MNKSKNTKGEINQILIAILAIVTIIVFISFAYKAYVGFKEQMAIASCKDSITAHTAIAKGTFREVITDIKCPTEEITIKDNDKAKEIIAEDMHRCWYIWNQGKGQYFKGEGNFCHICGIYQFEDKGEKIKGFTKYLSTQEIKLTYSDDTPGISYVDYFQGYKTPNSADLVNMQPKELSQHDFINTSQKYATIFMYASGKDAINLALENGGRSTAAVGGGLTLMLGVAAAGYGAYATIGVVTALTAGATFGTVNIWNPVGWVVLGATGIATGIYVLYNVLHPGEPQYVSFIVFRPYNVEEFSKMSCDKLYVNQMSNAAKP